MPEVDSTPISWGQLAKTTTVVGVKCTTGTVLLIFDTCEDDWK